MLITTHSHMQKLYHPVLKTTDFISKLETIKDKSKDSILDTLNVRALYTNIPNHKGIESVKEMLNNQTSKSIAIQVIVKFLCIILTMNNALKISKMLSSNNTISLNFWTIISKENSCRLKSTFANQGKANHPGKFTTCCFFLIKHYQISEMFLIKTGIFFSFMKN